MVEVIPVSEKDLGKRAAAAFAAGDLPDIIIIHFGMYFHVTLVC